MKTVEGAHGFIGKEHPGMGLRGIGITKVCRLSVLSRRGYLALAFVCAGQQRQHLGRLVPVRFGRACHWHLAAFRHNAAEVRHGRQLSKNTLIYKNGKKGGVTGTF